MRYLKKVVAVLLVAAVCFSHLWTFEVMATSSTQGELNEVSRQLRELESLRSDGLSEYLNLREELQMLRDEMQLLDVQIRELNMTIRETTEEITEVVASMEAVMASLEHVASDIEREQRALNESREDLKKANEILAARVRAMHENGQVNIFTVFLSSESLTDFLMRFDDLRSVIRFNRDFLQNLSELEEEYQSNVDSLKLSQARQEHLQFNLEMRERELIALLVSYEMLHEDLERQKDYKIISIELILEDTERYEQLLDLLEAEYYELQRRLGVLHARFDRERASAHFRHALPGAHTAQITTPRVHTVPAAPAVVGSGPDLSISLGLARRPVDELFLQISRQIDIDTALSEEEQAELMERMRTRYDTRVSPREDTFAWPVPSRMYINNEFRHTDYARHHGIDIIENIGAPIVAAADGRVVHSDWTVGAGYMVIIEHSNGLQTVYAHNSQNHVSVGDIVSRGQPIAAVGATGPTRISHLHFEVIRDGIPIDPMQFFE